VCAEDTRVGLKGTATPRQRCRRCWSCRCSPFRCRGPAARTGEGPSQCVAAQRAVLVLPAAGRRIRGDRRRRGIAALATRPARCDFAHPTHSHRGRNRAYRAHRDLGSAQSMRTAQSVVRQRGSRAIGLSLGQRQSAPVPSIRFRRTGVSFWSLAIRCVSSQSRKKLARLRLLIRPQIRPRGWMDSPASLVKPCRRRSVNRTNAGGARPVGHLGTGERGRDPPRRALA